MQNDLNRNLPSSQVKIFAINETGQEVANAVAAATGDLPLLQDTSAEDVWSDWQATWRDVQIVDAEGELSGIYNLTRNDITVDGNYQALREMIVNAATSKRVATSPYQNRIEPMDTTKDGFVAPNDVLAVINKINRDGAGELTAPDGEVDVAFDVTGDNWVSALDALRVIQVLNRLSSASGEPDPAGEPMEADSVAPAEAADAYFAMSVASNFDGDDDSEDEEE